LKHKLLLINLLLIGLVAASGSVLRQKWLASRVHEETVLKQRAPVAPAPVIAPIPSPQPAAPAAYNEVAQKLLTARDRNPNIFIEPPPKVEEKVMPPLPFQYGIIDFGAGPTVMLAEKAGAAQHGYHIGDKIGPFKLLGVNTTDILFDWDGKPVQRKLSDLVDKTAATAAAAAVTTDVNKTAAAAPAALAPKPIAPVEAKPGVSVGNDIKACLPGDASPAGTVADGMKKIVTATPFGQSCRWEPVK
jgi:hypothetical protein